MSLAKTLRGPSPGSSNRRVADVHAEGLRVAIEMSGTGVAVITTRDPAGRAVGTTAHAVSAVSLRPPLVLACLRQQSATLTALLARRTFALNVLPSSPIALADRFIEPSSRGPSDPPAGRRFEDIPVLQGALATVWCDLHDIADGGNHSVVVGHVTSLEQIA